jgi:hypothetical protein
MIQSFEFLQLLPALRNLVILQHDDADEPSGTTLIRSTPPGLNAHWSLTSLSMEYLLTPECVRRLGNQLTPKLTRLSSHLDDDSVRSVFFNLIHLEELSILGTEVTDAGLTGIPMGSLLQEHENMKVYREYPYIGDCRRKLFPIMGYIND